MLSLQNQYGFSIVGRVKKVTKAKIKLEFPGDQDLEVPLSQVTHTAGEFEDLNLFLTYS